MGNEVFAHHLPDFRELILATAEKHGVEFAQMVEKDYWIMQCLWGQQRAGYSSFVEGIRPPHRVCHYDLLSIRHRSATLPIGAINAQPH